MIDAFCIIFTATTHKDVSSSTTLKERRGRVASIHGTDFLRDSIHRVTVLNFGVRKERLFSF